MRRAAGKSARVTDKTAPLAILPPQLSHAGSGAAAPRHRGLWHYPVQLSDHVRSHGPLPRARAHPDRGNRPRQALGLVGRLHLHGTHRVPAAGARATGIPLRPCRGGKYPGDQQDVDSTNGCENDRREAKATHVCHS